ncbi:receptor-type tyrosine-protein phosphatase N2 [Orussus abietinus]|uniref:receptor-type tyrosine-protein phosphatase N2 n=1 Tax=Orussus abietinus TaxID=222816 RepID=UPI000C715BE4|nr:receptor-type tyrosine-protein phosphatase N2 [Orussus abietinus]
MNPGRRWRGAPELLLLCLFYGAVSPATGNGAVGCLFSENLCLPETEFCYDDLAFGRCISLESNREDEDLFQYNLGLAELRLLRLELKKLETAGFKWSHPYSQCIIQSTLYSIRLGVEHDLESCEYSRESNRHRFINLPEDNSQPLPIAVVKFKPSEGNPHGDYADELYYPPEFEEHLGRGFVGSRTLENRWSPEGIRENYIPDSADVFNEPIPRKLSERVVEMPSRGFRNSEDVIDEAFEVQRRPHRNAEVPFERSRDPEKESRFFRAIDFDFSPRSAVDFSSRGGLGGKGASGKVEERFRARGKPDGARYRVRPEAPFVLEDPENFQDEEETSGTIGDYQDYDGDRQVDLEFLTRPVHGDAAIRAREMYTEGGPVESFARDADRSDDPADIVFDDDLDTLLLRRELAGFKRRERLDVKKPGPPFATNNYAFKPQTLTADSEAENDHEARADRLTMTKKELGTGGRINAVSPKSYKNVDMDHVYIEFKQEFHTWYEGERIVEKVGSLLGLEPGALTDVRVGRAEVTFKVTENEKKYNASDVLDRIGDIRGKLWDSLGVEVLRAGIGDKAKLPATLEVINGPEEDSTAFTVMVAAGAATAGAAAILIVLIARRHAAARAKLAGLATHDPEASKDYQDLCRARMQAKQPAEKPESPRVISLSRESDSANSPSNRSSTSSWGEEPALTNMDISTGHMVLSYMEDHLKNKDRLDQEWTGLCAYEAEPSSTGIAEDPENVDRNRPGAVLPYDHSRVVLNDLANVNSSDYINASTIRSTDHDPRNPAYIATQGPLPSTSSDFWQLVWEQGSVVIVILTRLTEEGNAMSHRYWPEEGSELYHIYEVHLVSEHIWCDDYLVRSFYLKNLRTGETRTVTQFHFLSWPANSVPHSTKALLEFRRKVNKSYRGRSCPIVVHCSDGAGRTGTYCLIDMVLNRMAKGAKEIDIAATLEHIRDQRPGMVATKQQFEFVLMAVAEEVHAILKALPNPSIDKSTAPAATTSTGKGQ